MITREATADLRNNWNEIIFYKGEMVSVNSREADIIFITCLSGPRALPASWLVPCGILKTADEEIK